MKISTIFWCIFYSLRVIQSEKCTSRYFQLRQNYRLVGKPVETTITENEIMCAISCMTGEWCHAINFINNGTLQHCELYSEDEAKLGEVIKDELSMYYFLLKVEDDIPKTNENDSVSSMAHTPSMMTSSNVPISPSSTVPISMTSSVTSHSTPAVACKKIFQENPASTDGKYTIFGGTANETEVFCDMTGATTGCNGGGWTLVMRTDGQKQTFAYSANLWINKLEHQSSHGQTLDSNYETKLSTYYTTPFTEICLGMSYNNQKGWTTLPLASTSLFDLISGNSFHETSLAVSEWTRLIPSGTALQSECRLQGINVVRWDTGVRIGIIATKTCGVAKDYNSRLGFGAKGNECGQDGTNTCGNDARCDSVPNALSVKTKGYILVK